MPSQHAEINELSITLGDRGMAYLAAGVGIAVICEIVLRSRRSGIFSFIGARLDNIVGGEVFRKILALPAALIERAAIGAQIARHSPWIPEENIRYSYAWIKGAAGGASEQQVTKFTNAILEEMKRFGVAGEKPGVDFIDINMIGAFEKAGLTWTDGMSAMMEARAIKNVDEQECMRIVGAIGDAAHWETMKFLKPGITENQVTAHIMEFLYSIPGMEDVEDVIVSSGPNTWPNWRNFTDRIIQPGDIVFMDLAALTWNGYKSCYYRTYCVGKQPTQEMNDTYEEALGWLYDSIEAVKVGATTKIGRAHV